MKTIQMITVIALTLGLSQVAYADHHEGDHKSADGKHCNHKKHGMQDSDTNKDGAISREEFNKAHMAQADEMFAKMDANKDGKIDQAEREAIKMNMKDHCMKKESK